MTSVTFTLDLLRFELFPKIDLLDLIRFKSVCTLWCKEIEQLLTNSWTQLLTETEADSNDTIDYLHEAAKCFERLSNNYFPERDQAQKVTGYFRALFIMCQLKWNNSLYALSKNYGSIGLRIRLISTGMFDPRNIDKEIRLIFEKNKYSLIGLANSEPPNSQGHTAIYDPITGLNKYLVKPTWWGLGQPEIYDRNNQLVDISFDIKTFEEVFGSKAENSQTCCGCLG